MKELKHKYVVSYRWWRTDGKPINPKHVEELDAHAKVVIRKLGDKGFTSGEFLHVVKGPDCKPHWNSYYRGWWEMKEVE